MKNVTETVLEGSPAKADNPEGVSASEIQGVNQTSEMLVFSYWLPEVPLPPSYIMATLTSSQRRALTIDLDS